MNLDPYLNGEGGVCVGRRFALAGPGSTEHEKNPSKIGTDLVVNVVERIGLRRKTHGAMNISAEHAPLCAEARAAIRERVAN